MTKPLAIVILAAGKGTRMKSDLPKVLHRLQGKPLVNHVIDAAQSLHPTDIVLVVGYGADQVRQTLGSDFSYVTQGELLGTGHAVAQAAPALQNFDGNVMILYGDMPLLRAETLQMLATRQARHAGPITMLSVVTDNPRGFGRVVRDAAGAVQAIVEEVDCTPAQLAINELNVGVYCIDGAWLWENLPQIPISPKGEYYLTDLVGIAVLQGKTVDALLLTDLVEAMGINTQTHLAEAETALKNR